MSAQDPRTLLTIGQRALRAGELEAARVAFATASTQFSGPAELIGGGHGLRGLAQVAVLHKDWARASRTLDLADATYALGLELLAGAPEDDGTRELLLSLKEGRAVVGIVRADMAMRRERYTEARKHVDAVYPLFRELGDRPSVAELWVTTARLAEREGRWFTARTSWAQTLRLRKSSGDEVGQCDALIRMAEAMLADGDVSKARPKLEAAESLARHLELDDLLGRVHMGNAKVLELQNDFEGAWEKWLDAMHAFRDADPLLQGLSRVRMARTAQVVRPGETQELLQRGLVALLEAHHPDAVGVVLHQLAMIAGRQGDGRTALLAAVGADRARGGEDDRIQGVVLRALLQLQEWRAAFVLALYRADRQDVPDRREMIELVRERLSEVPDLEGTRTGRLREEAQLEVDAVLTPIARSRGLAVHEVGTRRAAMKLTGVTTEAQTMERFARPPVASGADGRVPVLRYPGSEGEESFALAAGISTLGRSAENAIALVWDAEVSRVHCALEVRSGRVQLRDLGSTRGTLVNGERVQGERVLAEGDVIHIGTTELTLGFEETTSARARVAIPAEPEDATPRAEPV